MLFLNLMLVGGALAGGIPLAIHLLRRNNPRVVFWGAMQFLAAKTLQQRRRVQLERLLLLLLRIAIPVVLALCMARPVVSWLRGLAASGPKSLVVLLDDSASMASGSLGQSGFERAVAVLQKELSGLPRGSEVAVLPVCFAENPVVDRTVNLVRAAAILEKSGAQFGAARPEEAFEAAARHLNFSRAADELSVTPGAVSQQIQNLEDYVGAALFKRTPKGLLLTDSAQTALPALREAFDRLA